MLNKISPILGLKSLCKDSINQINICYVNQIYQVASLSSSWLRKPPLRTHREPTFDKIALSVSSGKTGLSCALLADSTVCLKSYNMSAHKLYNLYTRSILKICMIIFSTAGNCYSCSRIGKHIHIKTLYLFYLNCSIQLLPYLAV